MLTLSFYGSSRAIIKLKNSTNEWHSHDPETSEVLTKIINNRFLKNEIYPIRYPIYTGIFDCKLNYYNPEPLIVKATGWMFGAYRENLFTTKERLRLYKRRYDYTSDELLNYQYETSTELYVPGLQKNGRGLWFSSIRRSSFITYLEGKTKLLRLNSNGKIRKDYW